MTHIYYMPLIAWQMIWFVYELAANTDDDSPDSDAELPSTYH